MSTLSSASFFFQPCIHNGPTHRRPTKILSPLIESTKMPLRLQEEYSSLKQRATITQDLISCQALSNHATESVEDLKSTLVQEIVKTSKQVPERYIQKEDIVAGNDASNVWNERLLIDLSLLSSDDKSSVSVQKELAKLRYALSEWGCFQIINHGITSSFLDELHEVSKQFFGLPLEEKLKYSAVGDIYNGYGSSVVIPGDTRHNWNDNFVLTLFPEDQRKLNIWPTNPLKFGNIVHEYSLKLRIIQEEVLKGMARSLALEEGCFLNKHGKQGKIVSRMAFYPPCPCPSKVYGAHPHADTTTISILLPDKQVEGLEIQKDNQWFKVAIIPGALYVNLGDFAEVMSNGIFKGVVHRVVSNSERERISVNAFFSPEEGNEIEPANELVNVQRPKLYNKFNLQTYRELFFRSYLQGKRVIDALKISSISSG